MRHIQTTNNQVNTSQTVKTKSNLKQTWTHLLIMKGRLLRLVFDLIDEPVIVVVRLPGGRIAPGHSQVCLLSLYLMDLHMRRRVRLYCRQEAVQWAEPLRRYCRTGPKVPAYGSAEGWMTAGRWWRCPWCWSRIGRPCGQFSAHPRWAPVHTSSGKAEMSTCTGTDGTSLTVCGRNVSLVMTLIT